MWLIVRDIILFSVCQNFSRIVFSFFLFSVVFLLLLCVLRVVVKEMLYAARIVNNSLWNNPSNES